MVEGALESDGSLAGNVLELTQMLTRYNQELRDRNEEKSRLSGVQAEFKKHLAWQKQRAHALNRNVEKLFNESSWLEQKTTEVRRRASSLAHPPAPSSCRRVGAARCAVGRARAASVQGRGRSGSRATPDGARREMTAGGTHAQLKSSQDDAARELELVEEEVRPLPYPCVGAAVSHPRAAHTTRRSG